MMRCTTGTRHVRISSNPFAIASAAAFDRASRRWRRTRNWRPVARRMPARPAPPARRTEVKTATMILPRPARIAALSCYLILLAGCASFRTADRDLDAASRQLATASVKLSTADHAMPQAEITPRGDFVVEGKRVDITPQQREEVLAYRAQYIDIAQQGIAIGQDRKSVV